MSPYKPNQLAPLSSVAALGLLLVFTSVVSVAGDSNPSTAKQFGIDQISAEMSDNQDRAGDEDKDSACRSSSSTDTNCIKSHHDTKSVQTSVVNAETWEEGMTSGCDVIDEFLNTTLLP